MTTSIGVAACTEFGTLDEIVRAADTALYQAKHMGRNTTCTSRAERYADPDSIPVDAPFRSRLDAALPHSGPAPSEKPNVLKLPTLADEKRVFPPLA
jgi:hypothetical protein